MSFMNRSRVYRNQSLRRIMVARGLWFLRELERLTGLVSFLYTMLAFLLVVSMIPMLCVAYIVMRGFRKVWLRLLEYRHPDVEFVKNTSIRTAIDTVRNQGLITALLHVKGPCDMYRLRAQLQERIVDRRRADGNLAFPHLRTRLTTRCGRYAWEKNDDFHLNKHIIAVRPVYRGRPITEHNIRECVSDIIFQLLPSDQSPWQVNVIPVLSGAQEKYCVLVRYHHLLSEDGLGLGDMLLLSPSLHDEYDEPRSSKVPPDRPMMGYFRTPVAIPKLHHNIRETFVNIWNSFISKYDPLENEEILKSPPYITTCITVLMIIAAAVIRDLLRALACTNRSYFTTFSNVFLMVHRHSERRGFTVSFLIQAVFHSMHPMRFAQSIITWTWWMAVTGFLRLPMLVLREVILLSTNATVTPGTNAEIIYNWYRLVNSSVKEAWYVCKVVFTGPRFVLEELLRSQRGQVHQLQTVSLCGRKVVSWSDPISVAYVQKICVATGSSLSEVLVNTAARVLRNYFRQLGLNVPDEVLATVKHLPSEKIMNTSRMYSNNEGWLCLALPTRNLTADDDDPLAGLRQLQRTVSEARNRQTILHLISLWGQTQYLITTLLPSFVVRLFVNYLSRSYSVTLSDIASESFDSRKRLLWGQEVESFIYWRTPQSNISLSLSLMNYGGFVRLGVMSDSQLSPQHKMLASDFIQQLHQLAMVAGIPRERCSPPSSP